MKLIIAGPRNYTNYELVKSKLDYLLQNVKVTEIVSGRCSDEKNGELTWITPAPDFIKVFGVDGLGERWSLENGIPVNPFPADWSLGKLAGPKRNAEMSFYADALIAFDCGSKGTSDMISKAKERGLKVKIVKI